MKQLNSGENVFKLMKQGYDDFKVYIESDPEMTGRDKEKLVEFYNLLGSHLKRNNLLKSKDVQYEMVPADGYRLSANGYAHLHIDNYETLCHRLGYTDFGTVEDRRKWVNHVLGIYTYNGLKTDTLRRAFKEFLSEDWGGK